MVAANVAVAAAFTVAKLPAIYRVHPAPDAGDLGKLRDILLGFRPDPARPGQGPVEGPAARPREGQGPARREVRRHPGPAGHEAGRLHGQERRPLRPGQDRLHPLHLAHPPLSRPRRPPPPQAPAGRGRARARCRSARSRTRPPSASGTRPTAEQSLVEWRIFRLLKGRLGEEFGGIVVDVIKAGLVVELDDYFVSGLLPFALAPRGARAPGRPAAASARSAAGKRLTWGTPFV
ncbi:MAG: hypothetical protein MZU79_04850 [Anaerotruncus sp.]|nr:hypothetical protein [Anaerotruncus sp.]